MPPAGGVAVVPATIEVRERSRDGLQMEGLRADFDRLGPRQGALPRVKVALPEKWHHSQRLNGTVMRLSLFLKNRR
jgi:hypothetical protein